MRIHGIGTREAMLAGRPGHEWAEEAYRSLAPRLWRAVFLYTSSSEIASDAVSEAFAQALRADERLRSPHDWIWKSAFRIAAGELKSRRLSDNRVPDVASIDVDAPESMMDLLRALSNVSSTQREILILRHYMGYSNVEIARILDTSPSAVAVQLHRATHRLRSLLREEDSQ